MSTKAPNTQPSVPSTLRIFIHGASTSSIFIFSVEIPRIVFKGYVEKLAKDKGREDEYALFAASRIVGWSAHRLEELSNNGKIIRPAYRAIEKSKPYTSFSER